MTTTTVSRISGGEYNIVPSHKRTYNIVDNGEYTQLGNLIFSGSDNGKIYICEYTTHL